MDDPYVMRTKLGTTWCYAGYAHDSRHKFTRHILTDDVEDTNTLWFENLEDAMSWGGASSYGHFVFVPITTVEAKAAEDAQRRNDDE